MTTPDPLGIPATLKIWHDNSGEGKKAGWYCSKVVIVDFRKKTWYARGAISERFIVICIVTIFI